MTDTQTPPESEDSQEEKSCCSAEGKECTTCSAFRCTPCLFLWVGFAVILLVTWLFK